MNNWQSDVSLIGNIISALTCLSVAAAIVAFWYDKRTGLPYSWMLLLIALWVLLCGLARVVDAMSADVPLTIKALIDLGRAVVGIPIAICVWWAVKEMQHFAPPDIMESTVRRMAMVISDLSEEQPDGSATSGAGPDTASAGGITDMGSGRGRRHSHRVYLRHPGLT